MTLTLVDVDGPLHAEIGGVVGAPRLVFVHGFTQTGRSWSSVAERFADRFEVMLIDAPGHAGSSAVRADLPTAAQLIGDTGGSATYIGYSMGGRMVLHLALARPDLVERCVLMSATAGIDDADERAMRRASDHDLACRLERDGLDAFLAHWLSLPLFAGVPTDAADPDDRRRNTVEGLASSLRLAGTGTQEPLWDRLAQITAPTLVITGRDDAKFTDLGRRLTVGIGPHATHVTVDGAGHAVHLERRSAVTEAIETFLTARAVGDQVNE